MIQKAILMTSTNARSVLVVQFLPAIFFDAVRIGPLRYVLFFTPALISPLSPD